MVPCLGPKIEPAVFVRVIRAAGEADRLWQRGGANLREFSCSARSSVQIVLRKFDASQRLPGKSRFGQMAVGELGADDRVVAELGAQARQRAVGGFEIARSAFR